MRFWFLAVLYALSVWVLDHQGFFIYVSYLPVYAGGLFFLFWALRTTNSTRRLWALAFSIALFGYSALLPRLPNGERKQFFLTATTGMTEEEIRHLMACHRIEVTSDSNLTFSLRTNNQTEDHCIVVLDSASRIARSVEFSVD